MQLLGLWEDKQLKHNPRKVKKRGNGGCSRPVMCPGESSNLCLALGNQEGFRLRGETRVGGTNTIIFSLPNVKRGRKTSLGGTQALKMT